MRIWSLHPSYLDRQGLIACWRETLLAQAVLAGRTRGYTQHPQLVRFRALADPVAGVGAYLEPLAQEADVRGYRFDRSRIIRVGEDVSLPVTRGQVEFEAAHLLRKLQRRSPDAARAFETAHSASDGLKLHPILHLIDGPVEDWERV